MAALPYMQLYVADYLADTAHLSAAEHGAYLLLMFNYWQRGEAFKAKDERTLNVRLASVARMSIEEWTSARENIEEFFNVTPTEWRHERIERDLAAVNAKSNKASAAGKASGAKRSASVKAKAEDATNERSTDVQQTLNHVDTDTEADTEQEESASAAPTADTAGEEAKTKPASKPAITFDRFLADCRAAKEKPLPESDPVFAWAEKAGIDLDFLRLAWVEFKSRYTGLKKAKRYRDWRMVFGNAVRDNWFRLWYCDESGVCKLTNQGRLIAQTHREAA